MNGTVPVTQVSKKRVRAYGDGSIIKLGPDRYRVVVSGGRDPISGKRIRPSVYAPTLEEARIKKAELLGQRLSASGPLMVDRNLTLGAYLDDWIAKKRDNERTHHFRLDKLRPVKIALGAVRLHRLTDEQVDRLLNVTLREGAVALAPRTRKHIHSVLRTALKDACESATIKLARNPAQTVEVKGFRDEFDPRILDDREYDDFLDAAHRFDGLAAKDAGTDGVYVPMEAAWIMFCERGLREGELLGLSWSQVDFNAGSVRIRVQLQRKRGQGSTKGKKKGRGEHLELVPLKTRSSKRILRLSTHLTDALKRHRTHQRALKAQFGADWNPLDLVFPTINGFPMQSSALMHSYFRPVCVLAGIPFSDTTRTDGLRIHDLRHTFATRHIKQHRNLILTKTIMGHSSITMTERYVHLMALDENLDAPV